MSRLATCSGNVGIADVAEQATELLQYALLPWAVIWCTCRARHVCRARCVCRQALVVLQRLRDMLRLDPRVRERIDAQQLDFWRACFKILMVPITAILSFIIVARERTGRGLESLQTSHACESATHVGPRWRTSFVILSFLVFNTFPFLLKKRVLYCWIVLAYLMMQLTMMATHGLPGFFSISLVNVFLERC